MSFNEANLKSYIEDMGMDSYTELDDVYTSDDDPRAEDLKNCVKISLQSISPVDQGNNVWENIETYRIDLWHDQKLSIQRIRELMQKYPGLQPAGHVFDDFDTDLSQWSVSGAPTIVDGWCHFPGAVVLNKIRQVSITGWSANWTTFKWKFKLHNLTNSMYFECFKSGFLNIMFLNVQAGKIYMNYNICTHDVLVLEQEYELELVVDWSTYKVTPYLDGVAIRGATNFIMNREASAPAEYFWDDDPSGPGGWDMDWVQVGNAPYINLNYLEKPLMIKNPVYMKRMKNGQHHWAMLIDVHKTVEVS